jgi:[ribosomal protein S5]-alanine N-acetyltransferase
MKEIVKSPRLRMRDLTTQDSGFLMELMNERPYIDNIGDRGIRSIEAAAHYIEDKYLASYVRNGFGLYLVELVDGATPIGICGLVKRDSLDHPDLGFAYQQRFWARGYAVEAANATVGYARDTLGLSYLYGVVSPGNTRSIHLLQKLGFAFVRSSTPPGQAAEIHVYGTELPVPSQPPKGD